MKAVLRNMLVLLCTCICVCMSLSYKAYAASGSWGNLTWSLDAWDVLTISGTGEMQSFASNLNAAWRNDCNRIKAVVIENGVTSIGGYAFTGCENLERVTISSSVDKIEEFAFTNSPNLKSVIIPASVTSLHNSSFSGCDMLTSAGPIGSGNNIEFGWTETIPASAFANCYSIVNVTIPESVTNIEHGAFARCSFEKVTLPQNVTNIGYSAFIGCKNLTEIIIPPNVTNIEKLTFNGCISLENVTLPSGITNIEAYAFNNCESLNNVFYDGLSSQWENIDFNDHNEPLLFAALHCRYYSINFDNAINGHIFALVTGRNVDYAEEGQTVSLDITPASGYELETLSVKQDSTEIPVSNSSFIMPAGNVTISATFKKVNYSVTVNPSDGGSISVSKNMATINDIITLTLIPTAGYELESLMAKEGNTSVSITNNSFSMPAGNVTISATFKKIYYTITVSPSVNGTVTSNKNTATIGDTVILSITPASGYELETLSVKQDSTEIPVSNSSFVMPAENVTVNATFIKQFIATGTWGRINWTINNKNLLTISGSGPMVGMSNYEQSAWRAYSSDIYKIVVDSGVTSIGDYAFFQCTNVTDITLSPTVNSIGNAAFCGCSGLTNVTIPTGVKTIGNQVFKECSGLTVITIPENITSIGNEAFYNCTSLSNIDIPNSVTSIGDSAFFNCSSITSLAIPENVTNIAASSFSNCSSLTGVSFFSNVSEINNNAFRNCIALTDVYFNGTQTQWDEIDVGLNNDFLMYAEIHYNISYTISFNPNGGSSSPNSQTKFPLQSLTLTNTIPVRKGWFFVGWTATKDSPTAQFLPGYKFTTDKNTTLYAVWKQPDFVLPTSLTRIDDETFSNCAFNFVVLSENTIEISRDAFSKCPNLKFAYVPETTIRIDRDAFDSGSNVTILGENGSYAEDYAMENGFRFVSIR